MVDAEGNRSQYVSYLDRAPMTEREFKARRKQAKTAYDLYPKASGRR